MDDIIYEEFDDLSKQDISEVLDKHYKEVYEYVKNDYTIDGFVDRKVKFIKRKELDLGLKKYKDLHYSLEEPHSKNIMSLNHLIVIFAPLDLPEYPLPLFRMHGRNRFTELGNLVKTNTYILRISDSNLISGSYYTSTSNFIDYEEQIQELIKIVANQRRIFADRIVMYGVGRGGTASIIHGLIGGYNVLAVDPIISREPWITSGDIIDCQGMFDFVDYDFSKRIKFLLKENEKKLKDINIITSDSSLYVYPYLLPIANDEFNIINIKLLGNYDDQFEVQNILNGETINLQTAIINDILYDKDIQPVDDISKVKKSATTFDVQPPGANKYWRTYWSPEGLLIRRTQFPLANDNRWLDFKINEPMEKGITYDLELEITAKIANFNIFLHEGEEIERVEVENITYGDERVIYHWKVTPEHKMTHLTLTASWVAPNISFTISDIKIKVSDEKD